MHTEVEALKTAIFPPSADSSGQVVGKYYVCVETLKSISAT